MKALETDREVTIVGCIDERKGEYESPWIMEDYGPYGFVLEDPIAYEEMISARGRLGIWKCSESDLL